MTMKKLSLLLAILTVLSLVFALSSCGPATATDENGCEYTFDNSNGIYVLTSTANCTASDVTIPAKLEDFPVKIGVGAFESGTTVKTLTLEAGVTADAGSFKSSSIKKIVLPNGFEMKGELFLDSKALEEVVFPSDMKEIPYGLFKGCSALKEVTIPEGIEYFDAIFEGCTSLEKLTLPSTLTSIGGGAFKNLTSLKEVHISDLKAWCAMDFTDNGRLSSDNNPFFTRASLYVNGKLVEDLVIPEGVTVIKAGVFNGASGIKTLTVPASVKKIEAYAFAGCSDLEEISLTNGLEEIAHNVFAVTAIKTLTIPASVEYVGESVVVECENLQTVYFSSKSNWSTWMYSHNEPVDVSNPQANAELMKSYDNYHYQKNAQN